jgi:hypothetical protein
MKSAILATTASVATTGGIRMIVTRAGMMLVVIETARTIRFGKPLEVGTVRVVGGNFHPSEKVAGPGVWAIEAGRGEDAAGGLGTRSSFRLSSGFLFSTD